MKLINKIRYRFSPTTYLKIFKYRKMVSSSSLVLRNHINDYYKPFLYSLFFGRLYKYITLYGARVRKYENNYLEPNNFKLSFNDVYKSKDFYNTLKEINESKNLNEFNIYGLRFYLKDVLDYPATFLYELRDLVIPYIYDRHLLYIKSLLGEGTYETENVIIEEGDIVIDVGANVGLFTLFSIIKRNASVVYAFEPIMATFELLDSNVRLNGVSKKVKIINKGLGDVDDTFQMSISNDNIGANSMIFNRDGNKHESVSITTLDTFIEYESIQQVDFIKVDIEGAERLFLEGAQRTLAKFQPKLSICTYHLIDDPIVLTELILKANPSYTIEYFSMKLYAY